MYSLFNFFLIPLLPPSSHKHFSMQLGTVTALFYLLVTAKFPFVPFIVVWDYALWKTVELSDLMQEKPGCSFCCYCCMRWNEVCLLQHWIHYCYHYIVSGGEGEFHNKIHAKRVLSRVWDSERVQFAYWSLSYQFHSEAEVAGANILSNVPRHLRPPVIPRD